MKEMRKLTPVEVIRILGWTDAQAGEKLGCSHTTIQRKKNGTSKWSVSDIKILSDEGQIPINMIAF